MSDQSSEWKSHLSQITTHWSQVQLAHQGSEAGQRAARKELIQRYGGAVHRYLLVACGNSHDAEELTQEFALRFVSGAFFRADPTVGRFRDYLKSSLFYLVARWKKNKQKQPLNLATDDWQDHEPEAIDPKSEEDFLASWRDELLARTWEALRQHELEKNQPFYRVLQYRTAEPSARSQQIAEYLTEELGREITAVGARQLLHRAREQFARLLIQEVANTLQHSTMGLIEQELIDLGLYEYCKSVL